MKPQTVDTANGPREVWTYTCPDHGDYYCWTRPGREPLRTKCSKCDHERRARARKRTAAIRNPPRPPFERAPNTCSLCGLTPLPGRRRSWCSDACVDTWRSANHDRDIAYRLLVEAAGERCAICGVTDEGLDVDHVKPLWSLTDEERLELKWWTVENLQLLCTTHHKEKTKREATERARFRRSDE